MILDAIQNRTSMRKYKDTPVTEEQITALLTAAMLAPSAKNMRPWEFIVLTDREKLNKLAERHPFGKMLETAPMAIIVLALENEQAIQAGADGFYPQDCGAATQNILLQAQHMGLGTCWCGVYPKPQVTADVREILGLTDETKIPFNVIAVGTPDKEPRIRGFYEETKVIRM